MKKTTLVPFPLSIKVLPSNSMASGGSLALIVENEKIPMLINK
jgi:hypothetical protein